MCFLPQDEAARAFAIARFEHFGKVEGQSLIGWRDVPVDLTGLGKTVIATMPVIRQAIIGRGKKITDQDAFRAQDPGDPQADAEPARRSGQEAQPARADRVLHAVLLDAHRGLQGPAARPRSRASTTTCAIR
jgi:hypothetical protein